ncbi:hypothetical protein [Paenibacillus sp. AK002]
MTSHVQDFDLKEAPQSGAYASMLIPNTFMACALLKTLKSRP